MKKLFSLILLCLSLLFLLSTATAEALKENFVCSPSNNQCDTGLSCVSGSFKDERGNTVNQFTCQNPFNSVFGNIKPPPEILAIGSGSAGISNIINKIIQLIYVVAGIIFVFMIIISALQWILSGGDKEAVAKARGRLTWAIIGIVFLALAFVIIKVIGQITGFTFFVG